MNYKFLSELYRKVLKYDTPYFTIDHLSSIGVSASQTHYLSGGVEPSFEPKFFEPISSGKLKDLHSEVKEVGEFPTYGLPGDFTDALSTTYGLNLYFQDRLQQETSEKPFTQLIDYCPWVMKWLVHLIHLIYIFVFFFVSL